MSANEKQVLVSVLRPDASAREHIGMLCQQLGQIQQKPRCSAISPHVSLIPTDTSDELDLLDRLQHLASTTRAFDLTCSHVGWFKGGILFLGVTPTSHLLQLHQECFRLSSPSAATPWIDLYRPGSWVPHFTIATDVSAEHQGDVLEAALRITDLPVAIRCSSIELLSMTRNETRRIGSASFTT